MLNPAGQMLRMETIWVSIWQRAWVLDKSSRGTEWDFVFHGAASLKFMGKLWQSHKHSCLLIHFLIEGFTFFGCKAQSRGKSDGKDTSSSLVDSSPHPSNSPALGQQIVWVFSVQSLDPLDRAAASACSQHHTPSTTVAKAWQQQDCKSPFRKNAWARAEEWCKLNTKRSVKHCYSLCRELARDESLKRDLLALGLPCNLYTHRSRNSNWSRRDKRPFFIVFLFLKSGSRRKGQVLRLKPGEVLLAKRSLLLEDSSWGKLSWTSPTTDDPETVFPKDVINSWEWACQQELVFSSLKQLVFPHVGFPHAIFQMEEHRCGMKNGQLPFNQYFSMASRRKWMFNGCPVDRGTE